MEERILQCPCGATATVERGLSIANTAKEVGWTYVASYRAVVTYLCPDCGEMAKTLAVELHNIVQDDSLYMVSLLKQAEESASRP